MPSLGNALQELRKDRSATQLRLEKLDQIISGIESLSGIGAATPGKTTQPKRIISEASRRKMALAQRARWASLRKGSQPAGATGSAPAKRSMSAAARRKISLVQKARWAKLRGQAAEPKPKHTISAAGKKRIAAAARARWAKIRAAKKRLSGLVVWGACCAKMRQAFVFEGVFDRISCRCWVVSAMEILRQQQGKAFDTFGYSSRLIGNLSAVSDAASTRNSSGG